ncbi:uncharacterized protein PHACADRAFT_86413 [Phanerochaete carnosa HHB-10118-sp]|uniref:Uncharacterized protein n=1 Tax=Phanerochaete carnosa (strain HHB-10118-sp) TaxID=650164 RepID=K5V7T8_PHACS|nr:uncharacterized protein PHACADRAFT_86413 [Phanerochaete carnosa HHB-10118-sp]EKM58806.1 hypothetical protein PHACADRAFT_86413 [Phanerochaete carnosa HHB-10118-sp]
MFRLHRLPPAPDEIYSSSLATFHEGHALWYPEPHESGEPQIGDVGFIHRGAFIRLFNLDTSAPEKKVTFWPVPFDDIKPLPPHVLQIDRRHRPLVPDHYCSHGMESKEIHASVDATAGASMSLALTAAYKCKSTQSAVLALKSEAHAETLFENQVLENYIVRNHDTWYTYATGVLGHRLKQENLVVICGWVKTEADWAAAAFSNISSSSHVSVEGNAGGVAGMELGGSHSKSVTGPRMQRQGRHYLPDASHPCPVEPTRDQCMFVKRYGVRKRLWIFKKIVASADYHQLLDMDDGRSGSGGKGAIAQEEDNLIGANVLELESEVRLSL